jgi:resuscitation-promoting factor RpfA
MAVDGAIGDAATWAAFAVGAYLSGGLLAAALSGRDGVVGRCGEAALRLYPRIARSVLRAAVAGTVGAGATVLGGTAAAHAARPPHPPVPPVVAPATPPAEPLDWPVTPIRTLGAGLPGADLSASHTAAGRGRTAWVVVRPGDCLWNLAARSLGQAATRDAIAASWPRWWAANRAVIGDDPNILRPGVRLRVPHLERSGS